MRQRAPLRREKNDSLPRIAERLRVGRARQRFDRLKDRLGLQDHPVAAAERPVVHHLVPVVRPAAQVVRRYLDQPGRARPPHDAEVEHPPEELREDGDDVKAKHRKP